MLILSRQYKIDTKIFGRFVAFHRLLAYWLSVCHIEKGTCSENWRRCVFKE